MLSEPEKFFQPTVPPPDLEAVRPAVFLFLDFFTLSIWAIFSIPFFTDNR